MSTFKLDDEGASHEPAPPPEQAARQPHPNDPNAPGAQVATPEAPAAPEAPAVSTEPSPPPQAEQPAPPPQAEQPAPPPQAEQPAQQASVPAQAATTAVDAAPEYLRQYAGEPESADDGIADTALQGAGLPYGLFKMRKDGRFEVNIAGNKTTLPDLEVDLVIVGACRKFSRTLWPKSTPGVHTPKPLCQSALGDVPDPGVADKKAETCAACPYSQFGSLHLIDTDRTPNPKSKPACAESMNVAVVAPDDPDHILLWKLGYMARQEIGAYAKGVKALGGLLTWGVSRVKGEEKKSKMGGDPMTPTFVWGGHLSESAAKIHAAAREAHADVIDAILNPVPRVYTASQEQPATQVTDQSSQSAQEAEHDDEIPF